MHSLCLHVLTLFHILTYLCKIAIEIAACMMNFLYVPGWKSYSNQLSGVLILHFLMPETKTANHTIMTLHVFPG